jgi:hypothetical protein
VAGSQITLKLVEPAGIGVGAGSDAQHRFECPLQMKRALVKGSTKASQGDGLVQVLLDITAHRLHHFYLRISGDGARAAAKAGTVAGFFGLLGLAVKSYMLATRTPRRAGWPAIYAGGRNCENEHSVIIRISRLYGVPPAKFGGVGHLGKFRPVEYRIGRHSVQRLRLGGEVGYPDLAVKTILCGQASPLQLFRVGAYDPDA